MQTLVSRLNQCKQSLQPWRTKLRNILTKGEAIRIDTDNGVYFLDASSIVSVSVPTMQGLINHRQAVMVVQSTTQGTVPVISSNLSDLKLQHQELVETLTVIRTRGKSILPRTSM